MKHWKYTSDHELRTQSLSGLLRVYFKWFTEIYFLYILVKENVEEVYNIALFMKAHGFHFILLTVLSTELSIFLDHMFLGNASSR